MILRRITEHVKAQNWTAVALDFVIVVVGVFIGIQVSNWNETRQLVGGDRRALAQTLHDVDLMIEATDRDLAAFEQRLKGISRAARLLEDCDATHAEEYAISATLYELRLPRLPNFYRSGLDDLSASDRLARIGDMEFTRLIALLNERMSYLRNSIPNSTRKHDESYALIAGGLTPERLQPSESFFGQENATGYRLTASIDELCGNDDFKKGLIQSADLLLDQDREFRIYRDQLVDVRARGQEISQ